MGSDDFSTSFANSYAPSGQSDDAFNTTVQPAISAGATLRPMRNSGKFHGMIWPATPMGILYSRMFSLGRSDVMISPLI